MRVVFNEACRQNSTIEESPVFSSVVDFVNSDEAINANAISCHFISVNKAKQQKGSSSAKNVKIFRYNSKRGKLERANPVKGEHNKTASSQISNSTAQVIIH